MRQAAIPSTKNPTLFTGDQKIPYANKLFIRVNPVMCIMYIQNGLCYKRQAEIAGHRKLENVGFLVFWGSFET